MTSRAEDLSQVLSEHLLGTTYDPTSTLPERFLIDHLSEVIEGFESGLYSYEETKALFARHDLKGFDLDAWIATQVDEGYYRDLPPTN